MNVRDLIDLKGALAEDGWISSFAKVSRPLAVTLTVAIPAIGGLSVGLATIADAKLGADMAANCVAFFAGLPEALYWMVGGIATGYFGAKAWETKSPPPPIGRPSPEGIPASTASPAIDNAIADAVDRAKPDPSMSDSAIDADGSPAVQDATFDEDADPLAIAPVARLFSVPADELRRDAGLDPLPRPLFGQADAAQLTGARFETKELVL
jgi:hypothetical protein